MTACSPTGFRRLTDLEGVAAIASSDSDSSAVAFFLVPVASFRIERGLGILVALVLFCSSSASSSSSAIGLGSFFFRALARGAAGLRADAAGFRAAFAGVTASFDSPFASFASFKAFRLATSAFVGRPFPRLGGMAVCISSLFCAAIGVFSLDAFSVGLRARTGREDAATFNAPSISS